MNFKNKEDINLNIYSGSVLIRKTEVKSHDTLPLNGFATTIICVYEKDPERQRLHSTSIPGNLYTQQVDEQVGFIENKYLQ